MLRRAHVLHPHRSRPRARHRPPRRCRSALRRGLVAGRAAAATATAGWILRPRLAPRLAAALGPWTADIYLLFCLGHADAWPAGDLALQEATRLLLALKTRPSVKEMGTLAQAWRPWRGAAACMLWAYYRAAKQRDGAPIAAALVSNG